MTLPCHLYTEKKKLIVKEKKMEVMNGTLFEYFFFLILLIRNLVFG